MAEENLLGESNQAVAFLSDGESDQEVRYAYQYEIPEMSDFICKSKMKSKVDQPHIKTEYHESDSITTKSPI